MDQNSDLEHVYNLRDREEWEKQLAHFLTLKTDSERNAYLASIGVNTFTEHAFTRVPLFDLTTMIPYDFMHVELEGSLKNELACMLYYFYASVRRGASPWKLSTRVFVHMLGQADSNPPRLRKATSIRGPRRASQIKGAMFI